MVLVLNFIRFFWNDLNDLLQRSYQFLFDAGFLTYTQREGIIILITKRNKDQLPTLSYGPITLLNIDYKM